MKTPAKGQLCPGTSLHLTEERADGTNVMLCPQCGDSCGMHHTTVEVFEPLKEDSATGLHITVDGPEVRTTLEHTTSWENPSARRNGIRIGLYCELCCSESSVTIAQRKGEEVVAIQGDY